MIRQVHYKTILFPSHRNCGATSLLFTINYVDYQTNPTLCRGRFIAPSADLSALGACSGIWIILLKVIIVK